MSNNIQAFFKENNRQKEKIKYIASNRFTDEDGKPIEWELRQVPTERAEKIKELTGFYQESDKIFGPFATELAVESVVFPDLRNASLQGSYGVHKKTDLLYKLLNAAEIDMLKVKALEINGYSETLGDLAGEAKN